MINDLGLYNITIDFDKMANSTTTNIYYKEYDVNTAKIKATLVKGNKAIDLTGVNVTIKIQTNEYNIDDVATIVDVKNGIIEYTFPTNAVILGVNFFELILTNATGSKRSPRLAYSVLDSIDEDNSVESESNYPILIKLIQDTSLALNLSKEATEKSNVATTNAINATNACKTATDKANKAVSDVNNAIAAGTVDLELKNARQGANGVQYATLKERLDNFSDELTITKANIPFTSDKGYVVADNSKNCQIDKLKLEGKTLVNLVKNINATLPSMITYNLIHSKDITQYTIILDVSYSGASCWVGFLDSSLNNWKGRVTNLFQGLNVVKVTTEIGAAPYVRVGASESINNVNRIMILEGDHTQAPPSYFEGLKSVGEDVDRIEVLSANDGNLFNGVFVDGTLRESDGVLIPGDSLATEFICVDSFVYTNVVNYNARFLQYDSNKNFVSYLLIHNSDKIVLNSRTKYIRMSSGMFKTNANLRVGKIKNISSEPHKSNKKPILYYNETGELVAVPQLREWDTVEKHSDGKYYYRVGSGQVSFNGSENWKVSSSSSATISFYVNISDMSATSTLICNKFKYTQNRPLPDDELISRTGANDILVSILKSKLETQDVAGFKKWLQANNVTVVYQLATPKVYECINLDLDSYANQTMILCASGAISPKMSFEITSHIGNTIQVMKERINTLESKVYNYAITQNRLMLASRYGTDSVTFKVDYQSTYSENEYYDNDLFKLLKDNILIGKYNYDYDKMMEIMNFYATIKLINWDMWDELWLIMELQHNPQVEEVPSE